jgi:hypothetical protein
MAAAGVDNAAKLAAINKTMTVHLGVLGMRRNEFM